MTKRLRRRLSKRYLSLRFRILDQDRHDNLVLEQIAGKPILVLPGVFNPALFWTSELLIEAISTSPAGSNQRALDLGTGTGIAGIFAAANGFQVTCTDINPEAVRCARINAILNRVEGNIEFYQGDLFEPVRSERFDLILFNPPYFKGVPSNPLEAAFYSPDIFARFLRELPNFLKHNGRALVALSSDSDLVEFSTLLRQSSLTQRVKIEKNKFGEVLTIRQIEAEAVSSLT